MRISLVRYSVLVQTLNLVTYYVKNLDEITLGIKINYAIARVKKGTLMEPYTHCLIQAHWCSLKN